MRTIDEIKEIAKKRLWKPIIGNIDTENSNTTYTIYGLEISGRSQLKINGEIKKSPINPRTYNLIVKYLKQKKKGVITF